MLKSSRNRRNEKYIKTTIPMAFDSVIKNDIPDDISGGRTSQRFVTAWVELIIEVIAN